MNKLKYTLPLLLLVFVGCNTTTKTIKHIETFDLTELSRDYYYQAYDHKWRTDPSVNPAFDTKEEAHEYANTYNMGNYHSYVVRLINYRYEVRIVNPTNNELLYTSVDFNDAYDYVVEYSSAHDDLVIFDLKTGKSYE